MSTEKIKENIIDINVCDEMETSFLEYAYSVIYSRALPDARDGLKPVQRRILFQMKQMGLLPDRGHVKSAGIVGDVMGKLHPHGDSAIYDALVRMAQPFSLRLPLVDGHGNFGTLDDGPAAYRYTEARLASSALELTNNLDEEVVDFVPNYDNRYMQPEVLPAAFPNLLVNGASGIAVGMATNIAPHNLTESINACIYLLDNPDATVDELMRFIPGPDLPEGGVIVGLDGVKQAYESGRGSFKIRANAKIERISARKQAIVVDQLPYMVGPERVIEKIKDAVSSRKLQGISAVNNLTDREHGLRLVIELKNGFNPQAVLASLFKYTPMEETFSINTVCLVNGAPKVLGLKDLLQVFIEHRVDVVRKRTIFRLNKKQERLHLVDGLLIAILDIDKVISIIRESDDAASAKATLIDTFNLTDIQAEYILELKLRRLTKFSRIELENEKKDLLEAIAYLQSLLDNNLLLIKLVQSELEEISTKLGNPRRTVLISESGAENNAQPLLSTSSKNTIPLMIEDEPCKVVLSASGLIARVNGEEEIYCGTDRASNDAITHTISSTTRSVVGLVTDDGILHKVEIVDLVALPRVEGPISFNGATEASKLLETDRKVIGLVNLSDDSSPLCIVTKSGVIKRMRPEFLENKEEFEIIILEKYDEVVSVDYGDDSSQIAIISSDAQLLRLELSKIRPQGRVSRGVAGMSLRDGAYVIATGIIPEDEIDNANVITVAACDNALPGTDQMGVKTSPFNAFPIKNRAGQGVRVHKFLKGEDFLKLAWVGVGTGRALSKEFLPIRLPDIDTRRDASGVKVDKNIEIIGK
ncbi:DNA topoisomerase IV subunit A [Actinomyces sp. zg-332]|uniref:DNA gyrase/topoisomerase IV subunit A n=1 Tax=Actinomyces sp. zg-332 TaxID=2708340 RepID=UPI00141D9A4A|nr:DNA topoisomerase IV subunit A [Actinomyces sp. zg-332]QPK94649.1 DNA topoisomerase IV subunit A [Actinomyces sp. zg-332]